MKIGFKRGPGGFMEPDLEPFRHKLTCYPAGPEGFSETTRPWLDDTLIPAIEDCGVFCLSPWVLTQDDEVNAVHAMELSEAKMVALYDLNLRIAGRNEAAMKIASFSTASCEGQEVDSGTSSEIGAYAVMHDFLRPIFGRRSDFRQTGENGSIINLQVQYWIMKTRGGCMCRSLDELIPKIREFAEAWRGGLI